MYTQFYSFSEEPFKDTPDPRFLFLTESHKKALDSMVYAINNKKGLILISGEVGTGKSILIHQLLKGLDKTIKTVFIYHPKITFEDLLKTIPLELNIPLAKNCESQDLTFWTPSGDNFFRIFNLTIMANTAAFN
jgi:general secretion pathway protein A